jgi:hypothetical protein
MVMKQNIQIRMHSSATTVLNPAKKEFLELTHLSSGETRERLNKPIEAGRPLANNL